MHSKVPNIRGKGIYYGWVIVFLIALATFFQTAETLPVQSVFLKPMTEEFGWNRTVFTGALAIGTVLGGLISLVIGPLIDRIGTRWILVTGLFILGSCVILLATINSLWQFYLLQIVGRMVAMGCIALSAGIVIPKWFVSKRGRAAAISQLGLRAGNTVTPIYSQLLISIWNWRLALVAMGSLILAVSILPVAFFMKRKPEDIGLEPDGNSNNDIIQDQTNRKGNVGTNQKEERSLSLLVVSKLPSFYLLVTAFTIGYIMFPGINLHLIPYLTDQGLSSGVSVAVLAILSASGVLGSLIFGLFAEKVDVRKIVTLNFVMVAAGFVFIGLVSTPQAALVWGFYQGLSQGGIFTLQQVLFADYYGRESLGAIRGVVWAIHMVANAVGPLAASVAYDLTKTYMDIFIICVGLSILASVMVSFAKPPSSKVIEGK